MNVMQQKALPRGATAPRRVMFYSHDTFGLGHLRRTLTIARYLRRQWPGSTQLIVTGSPVAGTDEDHAQVEHDHHDRGKVEEVREADE